MTAMGKPEVGSGRTGRRLPFYPLLDRSIMTIGTCTGGRPEWPIRLQHSSMATDAAGEELPMLPVIKRLALLGETLTGSAAEQSEDSEDGPVELHRVPAGARVRSARGSRVWSAPLPRYKVTPACSRV